MNILDKRTSGVLLHISSLPGNTGIGTLGAEARSFIDKLKNAGQSYWQILPVCPTSYGDSPYQSFSTFAGNPYFIDFDILCSQGFLEKSDYQNIFWGSETNKIDYATLYRNRKQVFEILCKNFNKKIPADFNDFCSKNSFWLDDYALFMAIKDAHGGISFDKWEKEIMHREENALKEWKEKSTEKIQYYKILQYFFFKQWFSLKEYAAKTGIKFIGDIPIYVASDSADVWASPNQFCLDSNFQPIDVAGCPPDGFSATGQLWGNPVYNWDSMKKDNYTWWKNRLKKSLETYDVLRIDHFRGFDSFYCIPFGSKNAVNGQWRKGPGIDFFNNIKDSMGNLPIIAEDLGFLTDSVRKLLKDSGFPGMKVLQFAFDSREDSDYLPEHYIENCVVYTGTHDNDTINGWTFTASFNDVQNAMYYFNIKQKEQIAKHMMTAALKSIANTCILTMQDLIGLGSDARMNIPSTVGNNWRWRATKQELENADWDFLLKLTESSGRK